MPRKVSLILLAALLLLPTLPLLADDDRWQMPDVGAWLLHLFDLDAAPDLGDKNGNDPNGEVPSPEDGDDPPPEDEAGPLGDPSG